MGFTAIAQSSSYQNPSQMSLKAHLFRRPLSVPQCKGLLHNACVHKSESIIHKALLRLLDYVCGTNYVKVQELFGNIVDTRACSRSVIQHYIDELNPLIGSDCQVQLCNSSLGDDESYEVHLHFYESAEELDERVTLRRSIAGRAQAPEEFPDDSFKFSHIEPLTHKYSISKPSLVAGLNFEIPQFVSRSDETEHVTPNYAAGSIPEVEVLYDQLVSQADKTKRATENYWVDQILQIEEPDAPCLPKPNEVDPITQSCSVDPIPNLEVGVTDEQAVSSSNESESFTQGCGSAPISEDDNFDGSQFGSYQEPLKIDKGFEKWEQALNKPNQKLGLFGLSFEQIERMPLKALRKSAAAKFMLFISSTTNKNQCNLNPRNLEILFTEQYRNSAFLLKENINLVLKKLGVEVDGFTAKIMDEVPTECNWNKAIINTSDNNQSDLTLLMHSIYTLRQIGFHALARSIAVVINNYRLRNELLTFSCISDMAESPLICAQGTEYRKIYEIDAENENEQPTFSCKSDTSESALIYAQWAECQKMYENDAENENEELTFSCISDMAKSPLICVQGTESHHMYDIDTENENDSNLFS